MTMLSSAGFGRHASLLLLIECLLQLPSCIKARLLARSYYLI